MFSRCFLDVYLIVIHVSKDGKLEALLPKGSP